MNVAKDLDERLGNEIVVTQMAIRRRRAANLLFQVSWLCMQASETVLQ